MSSTIGKVLIVLMFQLFAIHESRSQNDHKNHSFEEGFDGWLVENASWERISLDNLNKDTKDDKLPIPKKFNESVTNEYVLIPSHNLSDSDFGVIKKDFKVQGGCILEVYFTALAMGWKVNDFLFASSNPHLEVFYDDVRVFQLDSAISENKEFFSPDKWNQFRLFSSYTKPFNLTISIIGKRGHSSNILALDNIIVKETPHKSQNSSEPEMDVKKNGGNAWERFVSSIEKEMVKASSNHSIKSKPEFCDLNYESGPCKEKWNRYYYNRTTKTCELFIYGGCNGNNNNFNFKPACESICKLPSLSDDEDLLKEKKKVHDLHLDFEEDFSEDKDGWTIRHYTRIDYNNYTLKVPSNRKDSKYGISPNYESNTIFRRPTLLHPLDLIPDKDLSINFSLILVGDIDKHIHPFFEHLNPGFKIYIGDIMVFDFLSAGIHDMQWHNYTVRQSINDILDSPDLTNFGQREQILRIESWKGSALDESEVVILDDFCLHQIEPTITTTATTMTTDIPTTTEKESTTTTREKETTLVIRDEDDNFPCDLPMDPGPCHGNLSRFYFDSGACHPFTYGGCKGNANRFRTKESCSVICLEKSSTDPPPSAKDSADNPCRLSVDLGDIKCNAYAERYFYDSQLGNCIVFLYSGCGGNPNRFKSMQECKAKCDSDEDSRSLAKKTFLKIADTVQHDESIRHQDCHKGAEKGPCSGNYIVYAYDALKEDCVRFVYGGCGGNQNRFYTIDKCRAVCQKRKSVVHHIHGNHHLHKEGHCSHVMSNKTNTMCTHKRYFFDSKKRKCVPGCPSSMFKSGFLSKESCMKSCGSLEESNIIKSSLAPVSSSMNAPTIAEIILGVIVVLLFILGACLGLKHYRIQRNYGLFRNESTRTLNTNVVGTAYDNPTYNNNSSMSDNTFQLKPQSNTSSTSEA